MEANDDPQLDSEELRDEARRALHEALHEIKRVIVGQDAMLERLLVSLLAGGHVLLEGVPGLAKTLTVKTLAQVLGGSFRRIQFTPDLVPADLVGTRIYRPDSASFETELGPVFANFLLADEINRAPAKVQSALLEVMQEQQVTIGGTSYPVPQPFLAMATQNPIESEGTYPLPEAQIDRFLMKILVDYPSVGEEAAVVGRSLAEPVVVREVRGARGPPALRGGGADDHRRSRGDRLRGRADRREPPPRGARPARPGAADRVRREPARADRPGPRGAGAGAAARPRARHRRRRPRPRRRRAAPPHRALLHGAQRRRDERHRDRPAADRGRRARRRAPDAAHASADERRAAPAAAAAGRQGPGPDRAGAARRDRRRADAPRRPSAARRPPRGRRGQRQRARAAASLRSPATTCATSTPPRPPAPASRTCGCTCPSAR